jgi:hypothetical protein
VSKNQRLFQCSPAAVFRVIGNGWLYPSWVVGASRMRQVDPEWPAVGSQLHHSFGTWPLLIDDVSVVQKFVPDRLIMVRAKGWPAGEADVIIEATPAPGGCTVSIYEDAVKGPGTLVPSVVRQPLLKWRNDETLRRLAFIAEGESGHISPEAED